MGAYWIPIVLGIFGVILLAGVWLYTGWRMRLHEKGILDIGHDGMNAKPGEPKTIFDVIRLEKEFDKEQKEQDD